MLFKSEPHYAVSVWNNLVSFNHLWDYETVDEVVISALQENTKVKEVKEVKEKKEVKEVKTK